MAIEVQLKKWGNSIGGVLPRELVEQRKLKESDKVIIEVVKVSNLSNIYGLIKERKMSGQKMKDLARKGWESASDRARWKK